MKEPIVSAPRPVVLYTDQERLFPGYQPRRSLSRSQASQIKVSLVAPLKNEASSLPAWLASLEAQTRPPDEVIVVDHGSTDGSIEILQEFASRYRRPFTVLRAPEAGNIAQVRNRGIAQARHPVIACTDLGARLHPDWLEKITAPFEDDTQIQVAGGWYHALKPGWLKMRLVARSLTADPVDAILPQGNSIAFTRQAWESVGGFPEWLTLTGEDTQFALALKKACPHWAFVPEALIDWQAPRSMRDYWRKVYQWAQGNGEAHFNSQQHWRGLFRIALVLWVIGVGLLALFILARENNFAPLTTLLAAIGILYLAPWVGFRGRLFSPLDFLSELGAELAWIKGFRRGLRNRPDALARRFHGVRGVFFMLAAVPIDDIGGGQRSSQLTFELLRQGYAVIHLNKFPKYETVPLDLAVYHPHLMLASVKGFDIRRFWREHRLVFQDKKLAAIVEVPVRDYCPLIQAIREAGGTVLYELIDDWRTPLGDRWYLPGIEQKIIGASHLLTATERSLKTRLEEMSNCPVALVPNAVNHRLFDPTRTYPRPADLPHAEWIAVYTGSLWGDWFDWKLLTRLAQTYPQAAVVVIGDYRGDVRNPPPNLTFLGLRPQYTLPAYLAHADVAIIPRLIKPATRGMNPLKIYEYLAMRKPVVATQLPPLEGIPGVMLATDRADFIQKVAAARKMVLPEEEIARFIAANNWKERADRIVELIQSVS